MGFVCLGRLSVVEALDMLQCPACGTWCSPETTPTGRAIPHCIPMVQHVLEPVKGVYRVGVQGYTDYSAIERRVVGSLLTNVVGPPLTGSLLDIEA
jgi:hypothetical protein